MDLAPPCPGVAAAAEPAGLVRMPPPGLLAARSQLAVPGLPARASPAAAMAFPGRTSRASFPDRAPGPVALARPFPAQMRL